MKADDPAILHFLRRSMVARIATQSRSGRPSITPLYFVCVKGHIWLGTAAWTLAAREAKADPRVSVLFQMEQNRHDRRILRITGKVEVVTDAKKMRTNNLCTTSKYIFNPAGMRHYLAHFNLLRFFRRYHAQSAEKGPECILDLTPEQVEWLGGNEMSRQNLRQVCACRYARTNL